MYYDEEKESQLYLAHYGMPRRSGRYPWGSGENPFQHEGDFLSRYNKLKNEGLSEKEIADGMGITDEKTGEPSISKLRIQKSLAVNERKMLQIQTVKSMTEDGFNPTEIGRRLGINESTVRSLLNSNVEKNASKAQQVADILMKTVDEHGMIDVGAGVNHYILDGISNEKLKEALYICELNGYKTYGGGIPQVTNTGKQTNTMVLTPPGTEHKDIYSDNWSNVKSITDFSGTNSNKEAKNDVPKYPTSIKSDRVQIIYGDEGGIKKDGVIELRRGVKDLSLGNSLYAQVRIAVDNTHYMKGMAIYADDLPDGVDVRFNTNKVSGTPKEKVFKPLKDDKENPFGATIKPVSKGGQYYYISDDGKKKLGAVNKIKDEGDWDSYSDSLAAQFLGKQSITLIKSQLNKTYKNKLDEYEEIRKLNNPTVKKKMLETFADECDGAAVHLKAAALPRQSWQVILPVQSLKDNEIYAPNYNNGETVVLVRYPHGGIYEIPKLVVNNKNAEGKKVVGQAKDAVGFNSHVAGILSGADFDGDTVLVIPVNDKVKINTRSQLKGLVGFDPKEAYPEVPGMKYMTKQNTQTEMGKTTNLIMDMTLKGASEEELARAVRHSMVVVDAEKHKLNYKQSEIDNGIKALKKKYQGNYDYGKYSEGASTLLTRAKSEIAVPERRGSRQIDPETGEKYFKTSGRTYEKNGKTVLATTKSTRMAETRDARSLSSGTIQEEAYANYANRMKALANTARKEMLATGNLKYDPSAKKAYQVEVDSLKQKLARAEENSPREREAQRIANSVAYAKKQSNPEMSKGEYKKIKQRALDTARANVGAKKDRITITDREWDAIQSGAISENTLARILKNTDTEKIKQLATPKESVKLSTAKINRILNMRNNGYTASEIANALGISVSTVFNYLD